MNFEDYNVLIHNNKKFPFSNILLPSSEQAYGIIIIKLRWPQVSSCILLQFLLKLCSYEIIRLNFLMDLSSFFFSEYNESRHCYEYE